MMWIDLDGITYLDGAKRGKITELVITNYSSSSKAILQHEK